MNKKINNDSMEQVQKQHHQVQRLIILVPGATRLNL